jgi:hypothetical protein
MRNTLLLSLFPATLLLTACPGKNIEEGCAEGGSGTLDVHVRDFDASWVTDPGVDVYDASGVLVGTFSESGTTTLPGGMYTVAVRRGVAAPDTFAGSASGLLSDTISEVCVPNGGSYALDVTAEPQPSSSRLWGYSGETLAGYTGISDPGAEVGADTVLRFAGAGELRGIAWDLWGNLWTATSPASGTRLLVVEPSAVTGKGDATVLQTVTSSALEGAEVRDLDVDAAGDLWVTVSARADGFAGVLVFGADALRSNVLGASDIAPARSWSIAGAVAPERLFFDAEGGFYVSDPGTDSVFHVAALGTVAGADATAPADGALTPDAAFTVTIDPGTGPADLVEPTDMMLDETGLWVLYRGSGVAAHVSRSANGAVRSNFTYTTGDFGLSGGLVRDGANGLWVGGETESGPGDLQRFDAATADIDIHTTLPDLESPVSLAFDPPVPLPE